MTPSVSIIVPVHNRRETTLGCLRRLRDLRVFEWANAIVVDDGSTDGTASAVRAEFPTVKIAPGSGQLFWTGAIALGMMQALEEGAEYLFWLNDDCAPNPGALEALLHTARRTGGAAGGVCVLGRSGAPVYGGFDRGRVDLEFVSAAAGEERDCDALNGKMVCIARTAVQAIGLPDAAGLPHAFGDIDYTLRLRRAGFAVTVVGDAIAKARPNNPTNHASWLVGDITVLQLWRALGDIRAYAYLPAHWRFLTRHWGVRGMMQCIWLLAKRVPISIAMLLLPRALRRRWWGSRSRAWQYEQRLHEE